MRIGYQKIGSLVIMRQRRTLERALGSAVKWVEFQAGPPLLEALNAGAVDFGYAGDTPPIFAQAAGVELSYVGSMPVPGAQRRGLLVRTASPVRVRWPTCGASGIARHQGFQRAQLPVAARGAVGGAGPGRTSPRCISSRPTPGPRSASGSVDAWAIWDPFFAVAQLDPQTRVLVNGEVAPSNAFFLARREFVKTNEDIVKTLIEDANDAAAWSERHQDELARIMTEVTGVDLAAERVAAARGTYRVDFMTDAVVATQQQLADAFADLHVLPGRIDVRSAVWMPKTTTAAAASASQGAKP